MQSIFVFLFYLLGIPALLYECLSIANTQQRLNMSKRLSDDSIPSKEGDKVIMALHAGYCIWGMLGLFSSQWILFAMLILISFFPKKSYYAYKVDAIVSFGILLFIIINKYQLHYNLQHEITSWI